MKDTGIKIREIKVWQLLDSVDEGKFAIPKLQREFVWDGKKAAKLLDSIVSGMPIGVPMVWDTPRSQVLHLRQSYHVLPSFNKRNRRVWFIIDGQQRVSVLHHTRIGDCLRNGNLKAVDFKKVVLSVEKADAGKRVLYRNPIEGEYVSVHQILDSHWHKRLKSVGKQKLKRIGVCRRRLLNYSMHFMFIAGALDEIKECFLRINTLGMKLKTADAIITDAESLDLRDFTHEVRGQLAGSGFEDIPDMPILFALSATQGGTEARGRALHSRLKQLEQAASHDKRKRKRLARDWTRLASCFGKAVNYLQTQFYVLSRDYLGYDYMISMLALFYYWNGLGPSERQKREIKKWFWATSVGQRYSGAEFLRRLPADTRFFKKLVESSRTIFSYAPLKDRSDVMRTQYSGRTGIGCAVYCLLLLQRPVSIMENGLNEIPLTKYQAQANRKHRHHIFPRQVLIGIDEPPSRYNSIANICLLTAEENQSIGGKQPRKYLAFAKTESGFFTRKMNRHLIACDEQGAIWNTSVRRGFKVFLKERAQLICECLEQEAGIRLFRKEQ